jgi:hypothetical protein
MKLFCALTALAAAAFASVNPQLHQVKRVYILAMSSAMDQYLANQLATSGIFEVVTDPMKADAIFTDHVGEAFQKKLDDLYPPPTPPKTPAEATKPAADSGTNLDVGQSTAPDAKAAKGGLADLDFGGPTVRTGTIGRGKGNFFVVDLTSRAVLWSVYERPKNTTPSELTKTAGRVVKRLRDDLTDKKPAE